MFLELFNSHPVWPLVSFFLLGIVFGSFLNVCILRIPLSQSIAWPPSHCLQCNKNILWCDNIPIFSFLLLRGKCRFCSIKISWQYPLIEFLTGVLATVCWLKIQQLLWALIWFLTFICPLIVVSVIDLRYYWIPDVISLPFILVGLAVQGTYLQFQNSQPFVAAWLSGLTGLVFGGGSLWILAKSYEALRKQEGLGLGDVKLAAMLGAFLGWKSLCVVFFLASLLALIVGVFLMLTARYGLKSRLPFGPFLSVAAIVVWFWPQLFGWFFFRFI